MISHGPIGPTWLELAGWTICAVLALLAMTADASRRREKRARIRAECKLEKLQEPVESCRKRPKLAQKGQLSRGAGPRGRAR